MNGHTNITENGFYGENDEANFALPCNAKVLTLNIALGRLLL
jgi:hypothetical protein